MNTEPETTIPDLSNVIEITPPAVEGSTLNISTEGMELAPTAGDPDPGVIARPQIKMTPDKLVKMISQWVESGEITKEQARDLRKKFNISQGFFTRSKVTKERKKRLKMLAKISRRKNRYNHSTKGQTRTLNLAK